MVLELIIAASVLVSLVSFIGVTALSLNKNILKKILIVFFAFAAGSLLGAALFDIIPEAFEASENLAPMYIVLGILIFFIVEKFIGWHHCHTGEDIDKPYKTLPSVYVNLIAEGVHNFIDGTLIAAGFLTSIPLGIITTVV